MHRYAPCFHTIISYFCGILYIIMYEIMLYWDWNIWYCFNDSSSTWHKNIDSQHRNSICKITPLSCMFLQVLTKSQNLACLMYIPSSLPGHCLGSFISCDSLFFFFPQIYFCHVSQLLPSLSFCIKMPLLKWHRTMRY